MEKSVEKVVAREGISQVAEIALANGLELTSDQLQQLTLYAAMLIETNQQINLISRQDEGNVFTRHILHSLTLAMPSVTGRTIEKGLSVLDLGTGGGLPGIPLAIVRADLKFTLCDSIKKKVIAVRSMIDELGIRNARAVTSRAEELRRTERKTVYDAVVTRAVASVADLAKWTTGLLKPGSTIYALKGGDLTEELHRAKRLQVIKNITALPLKLEGYTAFAEDEKELVIIDLN